MKNRKSGADMKRRGFLLAGSAGAAGAVAAAVVPAIQEAPALASGPTEGDGGYRDTAHVRTYYELARV